MTRFTASLVLILSVLAATASDAGWVFYFRVFDQWTVVCSRSIPNEVKSCEMSVPPPELAGTPNRVIIRETEPGSFSVTARMATWAAPKRPLTLQVDGNPPQTVTAEEWGDVEWSGGEAATLVAQMKDGDQLIMTSHTQDGRPHQETFTLDGFAAAFTILRQNLRAHGIIANQ